MRIDLSNDPREYGGFDSRRSIRLYRDFVSPVTEFDDRYRRGSWIGADRRADATTLTLGLRRLTTISLDLSTRSTRYTNAQLEGWLHPRRDRPRRPGSGGEPHLRNQGQGEGNDQVYATMGYRF